MAAANYLYLMLLVLANGLAAPRFLSTLLEKIEEDGLAETITELPLEVLVWAQVTDTLKPSFFPTWSAISRLGEVDLVENMKALFNDGDTNIEFWRELVSMIPGELRYNLGIVRGSHYDDTGDEGKYISWESFGDDEITVVMLVAAIQRHIIAPLYTETVLASPDYRCKMVVCAVDGTWVGYWTDRPQSLGWEKEGVPTYDNVPAMHIQYADPGTPNETISFQEIANGDFGYVGHGPFTGPMDTLYQALRNYYNIG